MALQTTDLVMVGLGVLGDSPPNEIQSPLVEGIHLRWAFRRERGFPWYGYYLFRRQHREGIPTCLGQVTSGLGPGIWPENVMNLPYGQIGSDQFLRLTDDFPLPGGDTRIEFDLEDRSALWLGFSPDKPVRWVEVTIGFRQDAAIPVVALLGKTPVAETVASGRGGDVVSVTLEFDAISGVRIRPGPAALIDLCFVFVSDQATKGWELLPDFPYPMHLPIFHPDYPCAPGAEHIEAARQLARDRILYGDPDDFVPSRTIPGDGTISVVNGSPIVTGSGTHWKEELAGALLKVQGDTTAYTIMYVVSDSKLVLSREYVSASRSGAPYLICQDTFGQLHDQLVHLVSGGPTSTVKMAYRSIPVPVYTTGTVSVKSGSEIVIGTGTNWSSDLVGLNFQVEVDGPIYTISAVSSHNQLILGRPYGSPTDTGKAYKIFAALTPAGSEEEAPRMPKQFPLNLVLLGALHPAMAQMVGLYWVDQTAETDIAYDYLILADHTDYFQGNPERIFSDFVEGIFPNLDGYIVFNKKIETSPPLDPPGDPRAYALPGGFIHRPGQKPLDAQNNAGLRWELGMKGGAILPGKAVMYHVWRADLGQEKPVNAPTADQYNPITKDRPVLITRPLGAKDDPQRPPDWPSFPLYFIDRGLDDFVAGGLDYGLKDGWYSYQVSGIDIFGRHSANSTAASWYQWTPVPDPHPWYFEEPPGDRAVNPFAVHLLDKMPPPPPAGIEAYALDPADPTVLRDTAYKSWRASLSPTDKNTLVGLRVSWLWTPAHMRHAPDIREFRIYYQPEHMNAMVGHVVSITNISSTERGIETDIPNKHPADEYVGAKLNIGPDSFTIVGSDAGSPLRVRVKIHPVYTAGTVAVDGGSTTVKVSGANVSKAQVGLAFKLVNEKPSYTILGVDPATQELTLDRGYEGPGVSGQFYTIAGKLPYADMPCNIAIPSPYSVGKIAAFNSSTVVNGTKTAWSKELVGRTFQILGESAKYTIAKVDSETQLTLKTPYQGPDRKGKAYLITHPLSVDYTLATNWKKRLHVVAYNEDVTEAIRIGQDANGKELSGKTATAAGKVVSLDGNPDLSGITSEAESPFAAYLYLKNDTNRPSKLYRIAGINNSAKTVTVDGIPNIAGGASNWSIGLPVRKYEVFLPAPEDQLFEPSQANPIVYANIGVSAADDKPHTLDDPKWASDTWGGRCGNEGQVGGLVTIARVHRIPPEPPVPPPDSEKVYASLPDYHGHAFYTYRWEPQKYLKTHIFRALDDTLFKTDWLIRTTRTALNPTIPRHGKLIPDSWGWNLARKQAAANQLNAIKSKADYATLSPDARAVLGLLPGNEGLKWDSGLQDRDWVIRTTRTKLTGSDKKYFPEDWHKPDGTVKKLRRASVAKELNELAPLLLSDSAATIAEDIVTLDGTPDLTKVEPHRDTLWLENDTARDDKLYRITAVDKVANTVTLDDEPKLSEASSAWALYLDQHRSLKNDAMRVLAGLPGNEQAFTQLTIRPLDPKDPATANRRGPDDPDDFKLDTPNNPLTSKSLRAYIATLDGRSTNRYFFRSAYVDDAHNRSEELSLSSPPVYLRNVIPPRAPVFTRVLAGDPDHPAQSQDCKITLHWASNREADLAEYRLYRTADPTQARDIRLMELVQTVVAPLGPMPPAEVYWVDDTVQGLVTYSYRLVAVDEKGNTSEPSSVVTARAYDEGIPIPPQLSVSWVDVSGMTQAQVTWAGTEETLLQRRAGSSGFWTTVKDWYPSGTHTVLDSEVEPTRSYEYRLRVRKSTGATAIGKAITLVSQA